MLTGLLKLLLQCETDTNIALQFRLSLIFLFNFDPMHAWLLILSEVLFPGVGLNNSS